MPLVRRLKVAALLLSGAVLVLAAVRIFEPPNRAGDTPNDTAKGGDAPEFVGADVCQPCHAAVYAEWKTSPHAHNMARPTPTTVVGDFERQNKREYAGTRGLMHRVGDAYFMDYTDPTGRTESWSIEYVLGIARHQVYLHAFPDGRLQILPFYWNAEQQVWQDAREGPIGDTPSPIPRTFPDYWRNYGRTYNRTCMECHASRPAKGYDPATNTYRSTFVPEIDCEACHGPGGRHARAWQAVGRVAEGPPGAPAPGRDMPRLGLLGEDEGILLCATCHARKRVYREDYRQGEPYEDAFAPDVWEKGAFFVDGRPSNLSYHYVDYMMSACYRSSPEKLTCAGCHPPHTQARHADTSVAEANAICTRCHVKFTTALTEHTFHKPESPGSRCVECHMPKVDMKLQMTSRDHSLGVPLPELTASDGVPNACANCHAEDPPAWAQRWVTQWWGDRPTFQAYRARVLARADVLRRVFADAPPVEALTRWLDNPAASVVERASAARFLGGAQGDQSAYDALLRHRDDPQPLVRFYVADALASVMGPRARDALHGMLADKARTVRVRAYEALVLIDPRLDRLADAASPANPEGQRVAQVRKEYRVRLQQIRPDDPRALAPSALVAYQLGHIDEAERILRQTAAIGGDVPGFRTDLIQFLLERGRVDEAATEADKLAAVDPEGVPALLTRGQVLLSRGRAAEARVLLERAAAKGEPPPVLVQTLDAARRMAP